MKDKHTPGPWTATKFGSIESKDGILGEAYDYNRGFDAIESEKLPHMANAKLIAAAPEMKQKLDEMTEFLRIVYACIPEEIAGTCARQVTNWEMLKAKIEGDE